MSDEILELPVGVDRDYQLQLVDPSTGLPLLNNFTSADTLSAIVWDGANGPAVATPSVAWIDAPSGTIKLTISAANTATLEVQPWPIRVTVGHAGRTFPAWQGYIDLIPSPGTATELPVYGTFAEMLQYGGTWIKSLLTVANRAGFLEERNRARSTLDEWILARYRPVRPYGSFGAGASGPYGWGSLDGPNPVIKGYLDANYLILTPKVKEIVARLALSFACEAKLDMTPATDPYAGQALYQWQLAASKARTLVAEIDTNADGFADVTVNLGLISTRVM